MIGETASPRSGEVPSSFIREVSEGKLDWSWPAQVSRLIAKGGHDLILSLGQVVPHEVIGMASYNKNVFVGTGGSEGINKSHFLGACYGMERIMGRADTPVRKVLNYASDHFAKHLPIVYVLTVVGATQSGPVTRGLFVGDDIECFNKACELALKVNFTMLNAPLKKVVVYLDPEEFKSTWLGNKSIYRTRMAMADGGQLIVLAPGLKEFGEDKGIDTMIRKYGYVGTPKRAATGPRERRSATGPRRRRPPDPRLDRGPLHGDLLPRPRHEAGDREREHAVRRPADDDSEIRPEEAEERPEHSRRRRHLLHLQPRPRPVVHSGRFKIMGPFQRNSRRSENAVAVAMTSSGSARLDWRVLNMLQGECKKRLYVA